jgi:hypothetical protein
MHKTRVVFLLGIVLLRGSQCIQAAPSCQASYVDLPIKPIFIHKQILPKINPQPTLRYASGMQGLILSAGMTSLGYEALLAWSYHCSPVLQIKSYVGLQWQNRKHSRFKNIFLQPQIGYTIFSNDAYLYLNILAGPVFSYNYYQEQKLADAKSNFNVEVKLGGETELFLVKNIEVLIGPVENRLIWDRAA